jgi:hypothetical protein
MQVPREFATDQESTQDEFHSTKKEVILGGKNPMVSI